MEIEKKFLVRQLPDDLEQYEHSQIEQGYLNEKPAIRIRKKGEEYWFTYKARVDAAGKDRAESDPQKYAGPPKGT